MATSCDEGLNVAISVDDSRATYTHPAIAATRPHFRPKLSSLSDARAAWVMEELRPLGRNPCSVSAETDSWISCREAKAPKSARCRLVVENRKHLLFRHLRPWPVHDWHPPRFP